MFLRQVHGCHRAEELCNVHFVDVAAIQVTAPFSVRVQRVGVKVTELCTLARVSVVVYEHIFKAYQLSDSRSGVGRDLVLEEFERVVGEAINHGDTDVNVSVMLLGNQSRLAMRS